VAPDADGLPKLRSAARHGESIVTLPWVLRQTTRLPAGATVLVSGCAENLLNLELASLGFKIIGVDERECRDDHPNFRFLEANPASLPLAAASVDAVIAVAGLGRTEPGALAMQPPGDADRAAMRAWRQVLKPGGALMLTIPFGKASPTALRQIYDSVSLDHLLKDWIVEVREFAVCTQQQCWLYPAPEAEAARTAVNHAGRPQAAALILARK
jgi:SAM-dependent methyltransferase